jgi:hypothetical protein
MVAAIGCSSDDDQDDLSAKCQAALDVLKSFDSDPSTPTNIEPSMEDFAAFNEAMAHATSVCGVD